MPAVIMQAAEIDKLPIPDTGKLKSSAVAGEVVTQAVITRARIS